MKFFGALLLLICVSCGDQQSSNAPQQAPVQIDRKKVDAQFMEANRRLAQKEKDEMDAYMRNHRIPFSTTPSGIRYFVYKPSEKGDSIREGSLIRLKYEVSLLDGTICYSSNTDGIRQFEIGHENIESGIHRGLQYLKRGDKALIMIPSALAHGLLGDMKKIPPQSPIIYDVHVE